MNIIAYEQLAVSADQPLAPLHADGPFGLGRGAVLLHAAFLGNVRPAVHRSRSISPDVCSADWQHDSHPGRRSDLCVQRPRRNADLARLRRLGVAIPGDVRLAGFDGDDLGALIGLTTALFDSASLAQETFTCLLRLMNREVPPIGIESIPIDVRIGTPS